MEPGEFIGIVGESGSGKSVSMLAVMGLIDATSHVTADAIAFQGQDLLRPKQTRPPPPRRTRSGDGLQDALTSLNPSYTVGAQIAEVLKAHLGMSTRRRDRVVELLELVEIPDAANRLDAYPHQLSGGMNQRVMIAMAIACKPKL